MGVPSRKCIRALSSKGRAKCAKTAAGACFAVHRQAGRQDVAGRRQARAAWAGNRMRSEEHTSELQSLMRISYAVFCLKKKRTLRQNIQEHQSSLQPKIITSNTNPATDIERTEDNQTQ